MRIIVGGLARKCGKTTLACRLIALSPERAWTAVKISHHAPEPGSAFTLNEDCDAGDTRRFIEAGARRAFWLRGDLAAARPALTALLDGSPNWIVESTGALAWLESDLNLLVVPPDGGSDEKLRALLR
jgi:hypothetical protein